MKIITPQTLAQDTPRRWREQYGDPFWEKDKEKKNITRQLDAIEKLGHPIQPETIEAIIGNGSWTRVSKCDECGVESPDLVVEIGEAPDYESHTAYICLPCLLKAVNLARGA